MQSSITLLLLTSMVIAQSLGRPEKHSLLHGLGKIFKDVLITTTTTTPAPANLVENLMNRGEGIVKQQYKAHKKTILEKIGDYAEQAGINRGIAQAVSDQFIKDTAKKGKAYLGQRKHSTSSVTSETSYDGHQHMDNKENYNDQQHQRNQNQQQQYQQRPQQLINSHHSADDVEEPMVQQKVQLRPGYGGR